MRRWQRVCLRCVSASSRAAPTVALAPTQMRPFLKKPPPTPDSGVESAAAVATPLLSVAVDVLPPPSSTSPSSPPPLTPPFSLDDRAPPRARLMMPIWPHHGSTTPKSHDAPLPSSILTLPYRPKVPRCKPAPPLPHRRLNRRRRRPRSPPPVRCRYRITTLTSTPWRPLSVLTSPSATVSPLQLATAHCSHGGWGTRSSGWGGGKEHQPQ
jgi:hypothetical protein